MGYMKKIKNNFAFATSCDLNYLAQAHVLAKSVKKIYPESLFYLGLNETNINLEKMISNDVKEFDHIFVGTKLHKNYKKLSKRYGVIELCCSVKPELLMKCFKDDNEIVIYLDPDTFLTNPLEEVFSIFQDEHTQAIFTPHLKKLGNLEMEVSSMKHGVFNLGFLALKHDPEVLKFLKWWDARLEKLCIRDANRGIFTDQTWAALAVGILETKILRDPGYNFATWNLADHSVSSKNDEFFIDEQILKFAHFSSFSSGGVEKFLEKFHVKETSEFEKLLSIYSNEFEISTIKLAGPISLKKKKDHYRKRHFSKLRKINLKIRIVDFLGKNNRTLLNLLMLLKKKRQVFWKK